MLAVFALGGFAYFGVQAVLLNLYFLRLGFGADFIGPLIGLGQLIWAVTALPASLVGKRFGTRPALLAWQALLGLGLALILSVESLPVAGRPAWLVFGWSVYWVGSALGAVNVNPFLMRVTTAETRNQVFSAQVAVFACLGFVGSAIAGILPALMLNVTGGTLDDPAPFRMALWLAPVAHGLAFLLLAGISNARPQLSSVPQTSSPRPLPIMAFLGLIVFLQTASEGSVRAFFNVYLDTALRMPAAQIGSVFGLGQFVAILGALLAPTFLRRFGTSRVIVWFSFGVGLALAALGGLPYALPATAGYASLMLMNAFIVAARMLLGQEIVTAEWRTVAAAVQTVGLGLGWAYAAIVGGPLVTQYGFGPYFTLSAGIALLASLLMLAYSRRGKSG